ncbi:MAG: hypothetical protein WBI17_00295 [Clostridiaceae bacterium]
MEINKIKPNLIKLSLLTGIGFVVGGFFRTFLELTLADQENFLLIFIAIWLGFLVEAMIGMWVLASLLRRVYPFKKLWVAGVGAFAAGIFLPALFINQFFVALLILPGFLTGVFFSIFLGAQKGRATLIFSITLGFVLCQILIFSVGNDMSFTRWLYDNAGENSVKIIVDIIMNMIVGISVSIGVWYTFNRSMEKQ